MAIKQTTIDDVLRKMDRLIGTANALMERYSRSMEELESARLSLEEIRELLPEHSEEIARWADKLSKGQERLERYVILKGMGGGRETIQVETVVAREHIDRALREELVVQQELISQYQKNINQLKLKMAKFGDTTALLNEVDDHQKQIDRANEAIARIRQSLAA